MKQIGVAAIIRRKSDDRFLMGHNIKKDGWEFPGGKQEGDESIREAAYRELLEETGLTNVDMRFIGYVDNEPGWLCMCFMGYWYNPASNGTLTLKEPDKCREWGWYFPKELPQPGGTFIENSVISKFFQEDLQR